MNMRWAAWLQVLAFALAVCAAQGAEVPHAESFPRSVESYAATDAASLWETLAKRVAIEPFNLIATVIFLLAILHTFLTPKFRHWAHEVEERHSAWMNEKRSDANDDGWPDEVSFKGQILHFFGEVEAVFGIWAVVLFGVLAGLEGWDTALHYVGQTVNFTEPMFVVVIMALASTRPVLLVAQKGLSAIAGVGKGTVGAWWLTLLIVAPLLGSFITEPAAMTIAALVLARQFYELKPPAKLAYATIGLLFVNVSVGGTLTHFAAPPVLMVATPWKWDLLFMLQNFGWKAATGIVLATLVYYVIFKKDFTELEAARRRLSASGTLKSAVPRPVPAWIVGVQLAFMGWTVFVAHYPALFIGGFLIFLAFSQATAHHQGKLDLRPPLLVGFFLAGLVVHGGLQGWWIQPILGRLGEWPLFAGATVLTAFNDNAAITYLATLVPDFTDELKYAVVAGAVTGGGLTVIANAPNPAGQSILQRYFPDGVSPLYLALGALAPTAIMAACLMLL